MLTSREIVPLALVVTFLGAIGAMAMQAHRDTPGPAAASAVELAGTNDEPAGVTTAPDREPDRMASGVVNPSDLGALPLREAALPAPTRDVAAIRRTIAARAAGTYIGDMLAEDSLLVRWPDRTVAALRVWVQPHARVPNWNDRYPAMVRFAFNEWSAAGFPMRFLHVVDSTGADLHVTFTTALPGRQIGLTRRLRDRHGWIVGAEITIATQDEQGEAFREDLVAGIARHEVGHALGLGHASDPATVMFPESRTTTIGAGDRATLHLLYTLPPGSVREAAR